MIFAKIKTKDAQGCLLAHSARGDGFSFKKGRCLSADDIAELDAAGVTEIFAARLEEGDLHEDAAADTLAAAMEHKSHQRTAAFTGRSNFSARRRGLFKIDKDRLLAINAVDEGITLATLNDLARVEAKQMIATLKIIPFSVPQSSVDQVMTLLAPGQAPLFTIAPFQAKTVHLIQTHLPQTKTSVLDKTREVTRLRLASLDMNLVKEQRCTHALDALTQTLQQSLVEQPDLVLIAGASAIIDRGDLVPAAISKCGGQIERFGLPVDPGNLLLLGGVGGVTVLGLPGCARSPKINGLDWVLERLAADLPLNAGALAAMALGGLLKDSPERPLPRAKAQVLTGQRIAGLLLAAGQSRRMGADNKLLAPLDGLALVQHAARNLSLFAQDDRFLVLGHEEEKVRELLAKHKAQTLVCDTASSGLSESLKAGIAALPDEVDAVLVLLGDMPRIKEQTLKKLMAAYDPSEGRHAAVPTLRGKRGNPVLIGRRFFSEIQNLGGDIGAKGLLSSYGEDLVEVEVDDPGIFTDVDTPEALAKLRAGPS